MHKKIDRICCAVLILSLIVTILFMNGEALGLQASAAIAQSQRSILLMDSSKIHKDPINIKLASIDDFQMVITDSNADPDFLANCMEKKIQVNIVEP